MGKLVDPVEKDRQKQEVEETLEQMKVLDIAQLSMDDFKAVPVTAARQAHPFEGYPERKIKIGTYFDRKLKRDIDLIVSATWLVALNPKEYVFQDPSGENVSMIDSQTKQEVFKTIPTSHNRIVRDYDKSGQGINNDVVFDRTINLSDDQVLSRVAIVPSHSVRAQLIFRVNQKTGKIEIDNRYILADTGQVARLRKLFEMINYQQTRSERLADRFYSEPESKSPVA